MNSIVILSILAVFLVAVAARSNIDNVPASIFDCSGKADGNYNHPTDCTRFITCSNGRASDFACPDCGTSPKCHGRPYLKYSSPLNYCDWPEDAACGSNI
eukprot:TRINITY_DN693_c0_g1_i1.p1 TRINITY_DN693_c0_g1~~TRINITY_DN693_c0_g1_i1.p1  ORF type:complete len:100 (+),score=13.13 TRINITY_DN693_c0_g1_i1:39-338(+)